jgi:hypothetical protein
MNKRIRLKRLKRLNLTAPIEKLDSLWRREVARHYRLNPGPKVHNPIFRRGIYSLLSSKGDALITDDVLKAAHAKPHDTIATPIRFDVIEGIAISTVHTFIDDGHGMSDFPLVFTTGIHRQGEWCTVESYSMRAQAIRGHERTQTTVAEQQRKLACVHVWDGIPGVIFGYMRVDATCTLCGTRYRKPEQP